MQKKNKSSSKMVVVAKGKKIPARKVRMLEQKPGGSNIRKYKDVKASNFAGPSGGAPAGTYPINTKKRAKAALSYAHNAPNPAGIKRAVYKKYPDLKPVTSLRKKNGTKKK